MGKMLRIVDHQPSGLGFKVDSMGLGSPGLRVTVFRVQDFRVLGF